MADRERSLGPTELTRRGDLLPDPELGGDDEAGPWVFDPVLAARALQGSPGRSSGAEVARWLGLGDTAILSEYFRQTYGAAALRG